MALLLVFFWCHWCVREILLKSSRVGFLSSSSAPPLFLFEGIIHLESARLDPGMNRNRVETGELVVLVPYSNTLVVTFLSDIRYLTADVLLVHNINHGGRSTRFNDLPVRRLRIDYVPEANSEATDVHIGVGPFRVDVIQNCPVFLQILVAEIPINLRVSVQLKAVNSRKRIVPCPESYRLVGEALG